MTPPPTALKPDINNSRLGLKHKITKMGSPDSLDKSGNKSEEDDEGLIKSEDEQVELRKRDSGEGGGKKCRVLFR